MALRRRWIALSLAVLACAVVAAIPLIGSRYAIQLGTDILTFVILACSWNLISGYTGYVSFGQVSLFGIGAYATALLVDHTAIPWYAAVVIAGAIGGFAGFAIGSVMLRLKGILFALAMFGLARILAVVAANWSFAGGAVGLTLPAQLTPVAVYAEMALVALCAFAVNVWFARSGFGLDAMSVRDDEEAAIALGVDATRVKVTAFFLSAIFPAIAGGLVAWNRSFIDPVSAFDPSIDLRTVVFTLFGGIGTSWGPLLGTVVLMLVSEQLWAHLPELQLALFGVLIIAVVLVMPGGLVGLANRFGWLARRPILAPPSFPYVEPPEAPAPPSGDMPVLEVRDVTMRYDGVVALDRVSFSVRSGEMLSIIGANGAGKTTLFNVITGFVTPTAGTIVFCGEPITRLTPLQHARLGIARTFQIPRLMESMSVWENVMISARHGKQSGRAAQQAAWALRIAGLEALWLEPAEKLTPGQRRRLELARAVAMQPRVVLLDEVMAGMTRQEQEEVRNVIRDLGSFGVAAVAGVEHIVSAIRDLSTHMIVLDFGKKIADGPPDLVLRDPLVVHAYLGQPQ